MVFQDDRITERLRQTECPAFWKLETLDDKKVCTFDRLSEKNEEIAGQPWRYIVLELAMSYESMKQDVLQTHVASQKLQYCLSSINNADDNSFLKKYETAFRHLVQSFRAFVALEKQAHPEAKRCFQEIVGLADLSKSDLAAVYGIKGNVLAEYGIRGTKEAFVWVRKALKLDDTEPEWHFLLGKLHARWRHFALLREPSEEEVNSLEKAYELYKAPHTAVYLAENISERAKLLFHQQPMERGKRICGPNVEVTVKNFNRRALQLYNEAMEGNNDQCVHIMTRCARGFVLLPAEFNNTKLALELAEKAVKKAPGNAMLLATLSLIHRARQDIGGAIINAKRSANAGAFGSHIRLMNLYQDYKHKVKKENDKEVDIAGLIDQTLKLFPMDVYRLQLFIYGTNYFLFVKRDLFRSLPYFEDALDLDSKFNLLKDRYIRWVKVYLNLFELMFNEIECAISKESYVTEKEKQMLLRVREKIFTAWPDVANLKIEKDLVNKLKENRFPVSRGRTRTRKNVKKDPKKRKTGKKDSKKRLKSAMSLSAHSKDTPYNPKMRSSSDDRAFHPRPYEGDLQKTMKRPLSHGRSQSRGDPRKKLLKDMDMLRKSVNDLTISELKPEMSSSKWGAGTQNTSLETGLSQMTLGRENLTPQKGKPNSFSKRSGSFDRQLQPQKRTTAVKLLDDKNIHSFLPSFSKAPSVSADSSATSKSTVLYGSLTVANVEKLSNAKLSESRESLDSDDTLNSQISEQSLQKSLNTEQSASSVSLTTKRSVSLDSSRYPVQDTAAKKSESLVDLCETDADILASEIDEGPLPKDRAKHSSSKLVSSGGKVKSGSYSSSSAWSQEHSLSERLRDLSLERKPTLSQRLSDLSLERNQRTYHNAGASYGDRKSFSHQSGARASSDTMNPFGRPQSTGRSSHADSRSSFGRHTSSDRNSFGDRSSFGHRPSTERNSYDDRRSPVVRHPSAGARVVKPPGSRQRTDSESSVSSAGSDYVASRWSGRGYRNNR